MRKTITAFALLALAFCRREADVSYVDAAGQLTDLYAEKHPRLELSAYASGEDCRVLLIFVKTTLDGKLTEALHYGGGTYEVTPGGILGFARVRAFRGIVYIDDYRQMWVSGDIHSKPESSGEEEIVGVSQISRRKANEVLGRSIICN